MRRITIVFLIFSCMLLCCGCERQTVELPLTQSTDDIIKIQMVDNRNDERNVVREITGDDLKTFIPDLLQLKCNSYMNDPAGEPGQYYVTIFYANGDTTLIGTSAFIYISSTGEYAWPYEKDYYVRKESMEELFEKYCKNE